MKRNIKKICILTIALTIISLIVILLMGKTYSFKISGNKNYEIEVEEKTGAIQILEDKQVGHEHIIKIKSIKPGEVFINIKNDNYQERKILYIHKSMIITDNNYFGKCNGSEIIPISLSIILIYILYLLIRQYRYSVKDNLYQYKNIAYLGIIIFLSFFTINNFMSIFNYQGLFETINKIINSMSFISYILFPIAVITFILVTISNINLIRREGKSLKKLLGLFLGIFICLSTLLPEFIYGLLMKSQIINIYNLNSAGPYLYDFVESLIYLTIAYLECILIGTIIIAIKSVKKTPSYNKDYMIILGCQIKKDGSLTPLLKGRVDRALAFRNEQLKTTKKDLIFIPSGGKGADEIISESAAMKKYLLEKGIKEKNILVEDKSTTTYENIKFSKKLIKDNNANIAFSTTNYHVLRAGLIATMQGLKLEGVGSSTKTYFWINAFIREFIGTLYSERKKHIIAFGLITITLVTMIAITYLANNI